MTSPEPFWEEAFRSDLHPFGPPSEEVMALLERMPSRARVLDLGCGDGRNALPMAAAGHRVTAVDVSAAALDALHRAAGASHGRDGAPVDVDRVRSDLERYRPEGEFDLVIAHGVLHLLAPGPRDALLGRIRDHTRAGGWNIVAVFTDAIPPPQDLAPHCRGLFREGELRGWYRDWEIELDRRYVLSDEHPGGIRHRHPIEKLVARRPTR